MLTVEEAAHRVAATAQPLAPEPVSLNEAAGRTLHETLRADRPFPPFNRVTMDGIALAFAALAAGQTTFVIERTQLAGQPPQPLRSPSTAAVEIMTGAALPPGADTVVRYEDLHISPGPDGQRHATVLVPPPAAGHNVHPVGSDCAVGTPLLLPGTCLGAPEMAVVATVGAHTVQVTRRARVAVVSTGDELVPVENTPLPHQIRRSNALMLAVAVRATGAAVSTFHFPDDPAALRIGLPALLTDYDLLLLSGGVSKGKADFLPTALREAGAEEIFHEVSQRPGKPLWFGRKPGGAVVFGLPGNPVSTFLTYHRYAAPWLRTVQAPLAVTPPPPTFAALAEDVRFKPALTYFLLVRLESGETDGILRAHPVFPNSSGDMTSLLPAHGFMELPLERDFFREGEVWKVWRF